MYKRIIKNNFSRCARYYDRYSTAQEFSGSLLISQIRDNDFCKILDIGCGTGNFTRLLRESFPEARIKAIDISKEMVGVAKRKFKDGEIEFVIADGETINLREEFDLISSNAAFQWFEDLERTLLRYRGFLKENGIIAFSIFGPETFHELDMSLREFFGKGVSIASCNFTKALTIRGILRRFFREAEIDEEIYKENHNSLMELLKKIKYTGARGDRMNVKDLWTRDTINGIERMYKERFKDIRATYQIFFCRGKK